MARLLSLSGALALAIASPAIAQQVTGNVSATITNTTSATIYRAQQSCNSCTFTTQPSTSIPGNNGTGSFAFTSTPGGGMTTIQYSASSGGNTYTCQYQISSIVAVPNSCGNAPNYSAYATQGVYPSPHCTANFMVNQSNCNVIAALGYAP